MFREIIERAVTGYELTSTYRALFDITIGHMELAVENRAIVTRHGGSIPIAMFLAVTNARNVSPFVSERCRLLGSDDFLGPSFNHRNSAVEDSFRLGHVNRLGVSASRIPGKIARARKWEVPLQRLKPIRSRRTLCRGRSHDPQGYEPQRAWPVAPPILLRVSCAGALKGLFTLTASVRTTRASGRRCIFASVKPSR
jgi:hypothetical protein